MICARRDPTDWSDSESLLESREFQAALTVPPDAFGLVAMLYQSGRCRQARVQQAIAQALRTARLATCIVDLLDPDEAEDPQRSGDVELLSQRMHSALDVLLNRPDTRRLPLAVVSAGHAVAGAIAVANKRPRQVGAVVGCYGRPDLAPVELGAVIVPTLLVVPSKDQQLVRCNERVFEALNCPSQLAVIVGASRKFTEPGTQVACEYVVQQWCERHLRSAANISQARC